MSVSKYETKLPMPASELSPNSRAHCSKKAALVKSHRYIAKAKTSDYIRDKKFKITVLEKVIEDGKNKAIERTVNIQGLSLIDAIDRTIRRKNIQFITSWKQTQ